MYFYPHTTRTSEAYPYECRSGFNTHAHHSECGFNTHAHHSESGFNTHYSIYGEGLIHTSRTQVIAARDQPALLGVEGHACEADTVVAVVVAVAVAVVMAGLRGVLCGGYERALQG
jgi:hypothetical protein